VHGIDFVIDLLGFVGRPGPSFSLNISPAYFQCRHGLADFWRSLPEDAEEKDAEKGI